MFICIYYNIVLDYYKEQFLFQNNCYIQITVVTNIVIHDQN